jgi:hypothetical protein
MKTSTSEALLASPTLATGGLVMFGVSLSNWVIIMTLVYTLFLIIDKVPVIIERVRQLVDWVKRR